MRVLEVCPECGADIEHIEICTNPPISTRRCTRCSWKWEGEPEEIYRVSFNPKGYAEITVPASKFDLLMQTTTAVNTGAEHDTN